MKLKQGDIVEFRKSTKGKLYQGYILGFFSDKYYIKQINKRVFYLLEPKDVIPTTNLYRRVK